MSYVYVYYQHNLLEINILVWIISEILNPSSNNMKHILGVELNDACRSERCSRPAWELRCPMQGSTEGLHYLLALLAAAPFLFSYYVANTQGVYFLFVIPDFFPAACVSFVQSFSLSHPVAEVFGRVVNMNAFSLRAVGRRLYQTVPDCTKLSSYLSAAQSSA